MSDQENQRGRYDERSQGRGGRCGLASRLQCANDLGGMPSEQPSQVALLITQKAIMSKQAARLCKEVSNKR